MFLNDDKEKAILVWRSAALGDFILASPALYELKKNFPEYKIVLLTISSASSAQRKKVESKYVESGPVYPWIQLAMPHLVDECIVLESLSSLPYLLSLRKHLKKYDFRFSVLMLDPCAPWAGRVKKMALMQMLVPFTTMYGWRGKGSLNSNHEKMKEKGYLKHHIHGPLQFIREMPTKYPYPEDDDIRFDLRVGEDSDLWADRWISEHALTDCKLVILGPGAIHEHKMWPVDNYAEIAGQICERDRTAIVIVGTEGDHANGELIRKINADKIYNLCGVSTIPQSAALMKRASLFIGNDGGAVHLADSMGCRVISIVPGIEYPDSIEPWNNKQLAIRSPVSCAPCYGFSECHLKTNECMVSIRTDTVIRLIDDGLMG